MKAHHSLPLAKLIFLGLVNLSIYSVTYCQSLHLVNLLDKPDDWTEISLYGNFKYDWIPSSEAGQSPVLVVESPADPHAIGAWNCPLEGLKEGKEYVIEARYHSFGFKDAAQHVQAILLKGGREFHELAPSGEPPEAGWYTLRYVLRAREDYQDLELRLYLHNAANTPVKWKDVTLLGRTDMSPLR